MYAKNQYLRYTATGLNLGLLSDGCIVQNTGPVQRNLFVLLLSESCSSRLPGIARIVRWYPNRFTISIHSYGCITSPASFHASYVDRLLSGNWD